MRKNNKKKRRGVVKRGKEKETLVLEDSDPIAVIENAWNAIESGSETAATNVVTNEENAVNNAEENAAIASNEAREARGNGTENVRGTDIAIDQVETSEAAATKRGIGTVNVIATGNENIVKKEGRLTSAPVVDLEIATST